MYAQLIEGSTTADRRPEMDRLVTDAMVALNLVDRASGNAMMIVLGAFLKALASVAAISTGTRRPISVWEVNARA